MAKAIFVVPILDGEPQLPRDLTEIIDGKARQGSGFSLIGDAPQADTCLVLVDTSEAALDAMAADDAYLFVEDVP